MNQINKMTGETLEVRSDKRKKRRKRRKRERKKERNREKKREKGRKREKRMSRVNYYHSAFNSQKRKNNLTIGELLSELIEK